MRDSIARQQEAVRKQVAAATLSFALPSIEPPVFDVADTGGSCDAVRETEADPWITAAATAQHLEPGLLRAVIRQESAFRPCAVSAKGAKGLMQLMPDTIAQFQVNDPFDPAQNVQSGARYLRQLLDRFHGDLKLALGAYNAGPERIQGDAIPDIPETRTYVQQILSELEKTKP